MKKEKIFMFALMFLIIYIFMINLLTPSVGINNMKNKTNLPGVEVIGVGDSVSVSVLREHWYGDEIIRYYPNESIRGELYFFNLFKVTSKVNNFNWIPIHFTVVFFTFLVVLALILLEMKGGTS